MTGGPRPNWMEEMKARLARPREAAPQTEPSSGKPLREAAVLIPLYVRDKELWTLFTRRTDQVEHHKGQISFPGGMREETDQTLWDTAVRETEEEIGIPSKSVRYLGELQRFVTITDFEVYPYVGATPYPVEFRPHEREVEQIIEVPLSYLMDPQVVEERDLTWQGRVVQTLIFHYRGHAIWGATARILANFLAVLREADSDGRSVEGAKGGTASAVPPDRNSP